MNEGVKKQLAESVKEITGKADLGNDVEVKVNITKRRGKLPPNIMVFQAFAYLAAKTLMPSSCKVLMMFFAYSGYENFIGMDVKTISEELGLSSRQTLYALRELESNNIIIKTVNTNDRRRNDYFVNPLAAWKGNSYTRAKMIKSKVLNDPTQLGLFDKMLETEKDLYKQPINQLKE